MNTPSTSMNTPSTSMNTPSQQPQPQPQPQLQPQLGGSNNNQQRNPNNNNNNQQRNTNNNNNNQQRNPNNNNNRQRNPNNNNNNQQRNPNNNKQNKNQNNKQTTLIGKFIAFVEHYDNIDKIDDKLLTIINTAFKSYDNYDKLNTNENEYYISRDDFENFCINNIKSENDLITLQLDDSRLADFIKIYKDLKKLYIDNCEYLLVLLEKSILIKETVNDNKANLHFTLKNIGYAELVEFETDVRNRLVSMYSQCHEHYQRGIVALYKALQQPVQ